LCAPDNLLKSEHFAADLTKLLAKLRQDDAHTKLLGYLIVISLIKKSTEERRAHVAYMVMEAMSLSQLPGVDDLSQEHLALGVSWDLSLRIACADNEIRVPVISPMENTLSLNRMAGRHCIGCKSPPWQLLHNFRAQAV